jgi:hypothetical protein
MSPLNHCVAHASEPADYRCRRCNDGICAACLAKGERDLCDSCGRYGIEAAASEAGTAPDVPSGAVHPQSRAGAFLIAILTVANMALAGYLIIPGEAEQAEDVLRNVLIVVSAVEQSKDAAGRFPARLNGILEHMPDAAQDLVRSGRVRYRTDEGRTAFEVSILLGSSGKDIPKP